MLYRLTLIGIYNYDPSVFDALTFPAGINRSTALNAILLRGGEMGCIYSNPDFLKFAITNWSAKNAEPLKRIYAALTEEYNPLHNYDRYEDYTDNRNVSSSGSNSTSSEDKVSADNSSTYQPDTTSSGSSTTQSSGRDDLTHSGHMYGNIGVTTSTQMLSSEVDARQLYKIYDIIADLFVSEFCEMTY